MAEYPIRLNLKGREKGKVTGVMCSYTTRKSFERNGVCHFLRMTMDCQAISQLV